MNAKDKLRVASLLYKQLMRADWEAIEVKTDIGHQVEFKKKRKRQLQERVKFNKQLKSLPETGRYDNDQFKNDWLGDVIERAKRKLLKMGVKYQKLKQEADEISHCLELLGYTADRKYGGLYKGRTKVK